MYDAARERHRARERHLARAVHPSERSFPLFGLELHPAVVHYPIALGVTGALALLAYAFMRRDWMRWFGPILLTLALAGAGAAYFSGQSAEDRAEKIGVPEAAIEEHESAGIWSLGALALTTLLAWATVGARRAVWVAALLALVSSAVVLRTAHLGGKLVFIHGAGRVTQGTGSQGSTPPSGTDEPQPDQR